MHPNVRNDFALPREPDHVHRRRAGLDSVETRKIEVQRTFADFEDFWATAMLGSTIGPTVATMVASDRDQLKTRVRARLPAEGAGRITYGAWANAVKGRLSE